MGKVKHLEFNAAFFRKLEAVEEWSRRANAIQAARQTKGKTMLDTSKKYKVGSVVYGWFDGPTGVVPIADSYWLGTAGVIYPNAMQQLYDDGLAVEVKEPFEKVIEVEFNSLGHGSSHGPREWFNLIRRYVGSSVADTASVANRTFDVTIKERL